MGGEKRGMKYDDFYDEIKLYPHKNYRKTMKKSVRPCQLLGNGLSPWPPWPIVDGLSFFA